MGGERRRAWQRTLLPPAEYSWGPWSTAHRYSPAGAVGGDIIDLGAPNTVLGATNFGTITSAFDPRVVQLALKFVF